MVIVYVNNDYNLSFPDVDEKSLQQFIIQNKVEGDALSESQEMPKEKSSNDENSLIKEYDEGSKTDVKSQNTETESIIIIEEAKTEENAEDPKIESVEWSEENAEGSRFNTSPQDGGKESQVEGSIIKGYKNNEVIIDNEIKKYDN